MNTKYIPSKKILIEAYDRLHTWKAVSLELNIHPSRIVRIRRSMGMFIHTHVQGKERRRKREEDFYQRRKTHSGYIKCLKCKEEFHSEDTLNIKFCPDCKYVLKLYNSPIERYSVNGIC